MADPTADEVLAFLDMPTTSKPQAEIALNTAIALIEGYTRGRTRNVAGQFRPGIGEVVMTVAARILANPEQISWSEQSGAYRISKGVGFQGFTLAEQAVLNRYRKRAM